MAKVKIATLGGKQKHTFFMFLVAATAFVLAWGVWNNYRPTIIYAGCADVASRSSNISSRYSFPGAENYTFENELNNCLQDAEFYNN